MEEEKKEMTFSELINAIAEGKGISRDSVLAALKEAMETSYIKFLKGGDDAIVESKIIEEEDGSVHATLCQKKKIVKEVEDDYLEISKEDAKEAIRKLNNKRLFGQEERVVVEEAIGKRRDRDRRRYSRSRDRIRERNSRYRDRYYDDRDVDRYRYRRNEEYSRHRYRKTGPKSTDVCYNCGGLGHWANEKKKKKKPK